MKGTPSFVACGNSQRALTALRAAGAPVTAVDILPDPRFRQELSALSGWPTIPQIFVDGRARRRCRHRRGAAGHGRAGAEARARRSARGTARRGTSASSSRARLRWAGASRGRTSSPATATRSVPAARSTASRAAGRRTGSAWSAQLADRRRLRGLDRPLRPRRRAGDSLQRRRGGHAVELDPLSGPGRHCRAAPGARRDLDRSHRR